MLNKGFIKSLKLKGFFSNEFSSKINKIFCVNQNTYKFSANKDKDQQKVDPQAQKQKLKLKDASKSSIQRLKQIKEQKQKQQYQQKLQQINLTTGNFNPLTAYFWINRGKLSLLLVGIILGYLLIDEDSILCYKTMGVFQDPFTLKKKFIVVNPLRQNLLQESLFQIIKREFTVLNQQNLTEKSTSIDRLLSKKLESIIKNLSQKYGVHFKNRPKSSINFQIIDEDQVPLLWIIGNQKLLISKKLLRSRNETIQNLILLIICLHSRYLHLQKLSFWQRSSLKQSTKTENNLKLQKVFLSNSYTFQQIQQTINLAAKRYSLNDQQRQQQLKKNIGQSLKQLFSQKGFLANSKQKNKRGHDLRNRLISYFQFLQ